VKKFLILLTGGVLLAAWFSSCAERAPLEPQPQVQPSIQGAAESAIADLLKWGSAPDGKRHFKSVRTAPNVKSRMTVPQVSQSLSLGNFESGTLEGWSYDAIYSETVDLEHGVWVGTEPPTVYPWNLEALGYEPTSQGLAINATPPLSYTFLYKDFTMPAGEDFELKFAIRWKNFSPVAGILDWQAPTLPPPASDEDPFDGQDIIIKLIDRDTGEEFLKLQASDGWAMFSDGANPLELYIPGDFESLFLAFAVPVGYEFWTNPLQGSPAGRNVRLQIERYNTVFPLVLNLDEIEIAYTPASSGPVTVNVDIMPGSDVNPINLKSNGVIPVAILSTSVFDATTIDGVTVSFAGASPSHKSGHYEDVNGDGKLDWLCHFKTQETSIQEGQTTANLTGKTKSGQDVQGTDSIQISKGSSKGK